MDLNNDRKYLLLLHKEPERELQGVLYSVISMAHLKAKAMEICGI